MQCSKSTVFPYRASQYLPDNGQKEPKPIMPDNAPRANGRQTSKHKAHRHYRAVRSQADNARLPPDYRAGGPIRAPTRLGCFLTCEKQKEDAAVKPKMMVHPSQARCISSPAEQERLAAQDWLFAYGKPKSKAAKRMRALRRKRQAEGWVNLPMWFSPVQVAALKAAKRSE